MYDLGRIFNLTLWGPHCLWSFVVLSRSISDVCCCGTPRSLCALQICVGVIGHWSACVLLKQHIIIVQQHAGECEGCCRRLMSRNGFLVNWGWKRGAADGVPDNHSEHTLGRLWVPGHLSPDHKRKQLVIFVSGLGGSLQSDHKRFLKLYFCCSLRYTFRARRL